MEVEALRLIRQKTALPVPEVWAWGVADISPLNLGPFILMTFIEGVCLKDVLIESGSQVLKRHLPDDTIELIYRQMANIMLQLFKIDFYRIGSLPTTTTNFAVPTRPLTWKAHDILQTGGINTFDNQNQKLSTTRQYFHYVLGQDWQQLQNQLNSVAGETNARL
ncbi:uncharacterized protein N7479_002316 [Penicillium vulpinum]|uniref:uncharacterized protein n=1 Tax=Penicillium vulpinum TaxID=29845 RepID=UPI0025478025|nr:uncharacterized protein N7479_002316 [Penicillium vulpinum]KAJ5972398.1 hypothetical protein N7479_002316 [Penicillium vulpinum]